MDDEPPPRVTTPGAPPPHDLAEVKGAMHTTFWRIILSVLVISAILALLALIGRR